MNPLWALVLLFAVLAAGMGTALVLLRRRVHALTGQLRQKQGGHVRPEREAANEAHQHEALEKALALARAKLQAAKKLDAAMKEKLHAAEELRRKCEEEAKRLNQALQGVEAERDRVKRALAEAAKDRRLLEITLEEANKARHLAEPALGEAEEKLQPAKETLNKVQGELDSARESLASKDASRQKAETERDQANLALEKAAADRKLLEKTLEETAEALALAEAGGKLQQETLKKVQGELDSATGLRQQAKGERDRALGDLAAKERELAGAQKKLAHACKMRERTKKQRDEARRDLRTAIDDLRRERGAEPVPGAAQAPARLEVVCWERGRAWTIAVQIPEELLDHQDLEVLQDGQPLGDPDDREERCWPLRGLGGSIVARCTEAEAAERMLDLGDSPFLLFKMGGRERGRRVRAVSRGRYLAVVPNDWQYVEEGEGQLPDAAMDTALDGYKAQWLYVEDNGGPTHFRKPEGETVSIPTTHSRFELKGKVIDDANEDDGPLFGHGPVHIRDVNQPCWQNVGTIVVEGEGEETSLQPIPGSLDQEVPVPPQGGGRFTVRCYDSIGELMDSVNFRFLPGLEAIELAQPPLFPPQPGDGHAELRVTFHHGSAVNVERIDERLREVQRTGEQKCTATIPANWAFDLTRWRVQLRTGNQVRASVTAVVRVDRIWWAVGDENRVPDDWGDVSLTPHPERMANGPTKAIWIRLPRTRWVGKVKVGFQAGEQPEYRVPVNDATRGIPLRDFGNAQVLQQVGTHDLVLRVHPNGGGEVSGTLCQVAVRAKCKIARCASEIASEEEMRAHAKKTHLDDLLPRATPQEVHALFPTFPHEIYRCLHCPQYVPADSPLNPTTAITRHLDERHPRHAGVPPRGWRIVNDLHEIRTAVDASYPEIRACASCFPHRTAQGEEHLQSIRPLRDGAGGHGPLLLHRDNQGSLRLHEMSENAMLDHLVERHWNRLWTREVRWPDGPR